MERGQAEKLLKEYELAGKLDTVVHFLLTSSGYNSMQRNTYHRHCTWISHVDLLHDLSFVLDLDENQVRQLIEENTNE